MLMRIPVEQGLSLLWSHIMLMRIYVIRVHIRKECSGIIVKCDCGKGRGMTMWVQHRTSNTTQTARQVWGGNTTVAWL